MPIPYTLKSFYEAETVAAVVVAAHAVGGFRVQLVARVIRPKLSFFNYIFPILTQSKLHSCAGVKARA